MRNYFVLALVLALGGSAFADGNRDVLISHASAAVGRMKTALSPMPFDDIPVVSSTADKSDASESVGRPASESLALTPSKPASMVDDAPTVCFTSVAGCTWTTVLGCTNGTFPKACTYTMYPANCNADTSSGVCGTQLTTSDATNCRGRFTFIYVMCTTSSDYCTKATLAQGGNCHTMADCSAKSYALECVNTFGGHDDCSSAGACNTTFGINCHDKTYLDQSCGSKTSVGGQAGMAVACTTQTTTGAGGSTNLLSLMALALGSFALRKFGISV